MWWRVQGSEEWFNTFISNFVHTNIVPIISLFLFLQKVDGQQALYIIIYYSIDRSQTYTGLSVYVYGV